ncbi:MAG: efflux RND transporter periplasmic adaptor subunit [Ignavibacteria bacterium]|nr:efflux RND transporter periplasmic adaptor subunit [Ignavibacteria bacterium]
MMSKHVLRIVIGIAVVAIGIVAWVTLRSPTPANKAMNAGKRATPTVNAVVLVPRPFKESLTLTGSILAAEQVDVRSEVNGRVTDINFSEGSYVKKGQVLVTLDDAELRARLSRTKAQLILDKNRFGRQEQLKKIDGVSAEDFEAAQAQVSIREAEITELETQISRTRIRAPFSGMVGLRNISVGAVISSQTLITTLADVSTLKLEFSAPERFVRGFGVGTITTFRVKDRMGSDSFLAKVYALDPVLEKETRSLRVRANVLKGIQFNSFLRPGMFAEVTMQLTSVDDALLVPSEAIQPGMSGTSVFVLNGNRASVTEVEMGGRDESFVRLLKGVKAGDTVATSGLLILKDGLPVHVRLQ